jgi:hypothetical protein
MQILKIGVFLFSIQVPHELPSPSQMGANRPIPISELRKGPSIVQGTSHITFVISFFVKPVCNYNIINDVDK